MTGRDLHTLLAHATADPRSDAELVADAHDPTAFTALVRRHGPLVWGTARRMLPDPADAADAFQAVFLALARSHRRIRTPAAVGGWLHAATVRVCLKQRRQLARRRLREKRAARSEVTNPVADAAWDAILAAVHEEIDRLPAGERTAFVVCELQGVPQPEAAMRLGWKPGTLTGRLSKARARLLTRLSARGFAPAAGLTTAGALAVPAEVLALADPAAPASAAVVALSSEVTAMVTTKHLAAAVLVTAGLLAGVGGLVAQDGGTPAKPVPAAGPPPGGLPGSPDGGEPIPATALPAAPAAGYARWEYEYHVQPGGRKEFTDLVSGRGRAGWEFVGVVQVSVGPAAGQPGGGGGPHGGGIGGIGGIGSGPGGMNGIGGYGISGGGIGGNGIGGGIGGGPGGISGAGGGIGGIGGGIGGMPAAVGAGLAGVPGRLVNLLVFKRPAGGAVTVSPSTPPERPTVRTYSVLPGTASEVTKLLPALVKQHYPKSGDFIVVAQQDDKIQVFATAADFRLIEAVLRAGVTSRSDTRPSLPAPTSAEPRPTPPATVSGFQTIPLKHAKAADVARTVRDLLTPPADPTLPRHLKRFAVSADDRRNVLLFQPAWNNEPSEQQVRELVKELDVPAK